MSNILIINGAKSFNFARGELNELYVNTAREVLSKLGHNVCVTKADCEFEPHDEITKILNSDVLIYQMPGWWMGEPWTVKKWVDEVFTAGQGPSMKVMAVHVLMARKSTDRAVFFRTKNTCCP